MESLFETITSIDGLIAELNRVQPSYFFGFDFDTDLFWHRDRSFKSIVWTDDTSIIFSMGSPVQRMILIDGLMDCWRLNAETLVHSIIFVYR